MPLVDPAVSILRKMKRGALRQYRRTDNPEDLKMALAAQDRLNSMSTPEAASNIVSYGARRDYALQKQAQAQKQDVSFNDLAEQYRTGKIDYETFARGLGNEPRQSKYVFGPGETPPKDKLSTEESDEEKRRSNSALDAAMGSIMNTARAAGSTFAAADAATPTDEERKTRPSVQGATGVQGARGVDGATGLQGARGVDGATGLQGARGLDGATGVQGARGLDGATGLQGARGVDGATGLQGARGVDGAMGVQGAQKSALEVAMETVTGTNRQYAAADAATPTDEEQKTSAQTPTAPPMRMTTGSFSGSIKSSGAAGSPRINKATGLPFGYRPGDELPTTTSPEVRSAAEESMARQQEAQKNPPARPSAQEEFNMNEQMRESRSIGLQDYKRIKNDLTNRVRQERAKKLAEQAVSGDQQSLAERENFIPSGTTYDVEKREFKLPEGAKPSPVVDELNRAAGTIDPRTGSSGRVQVSPEVLDRLRGGTGRGVTGAPQEMGGNEFVEAAREYLRGEERFRPDARKRVETRKKEAETYFGRQEIDPRTGRVFTPYSRGRNFSDTKIKYPRYGYMSR